MVWVPVCHLNGGFNQSCVLPYANPRSFLPHNHNPDADAIEFATLKATPKERAGVGDVQPTRLIAQALLDASDTAKDHVKMQTVRRGIRRYRQGMVDAPPRHHLRRPVDDDWRRRPEAVPQARQRAERPRPRHRVRDG